MNEHGFSLVNELTPEWQNELSCLKAQLDSISQRIAVAPTNPGSDKIFRAIDRPISESKVVIVGQDPYPNPDHACGLAFSIPATTTQALPPTLRNILTELREDIGASTAENGDLSPWSGQGVILLNRILTTKPGESLAHKGWGWQAITNVVVQRLASQGAIFVLWGRFAQELAPLIPEAQRIESVHPSPLSAYRGFFGSKPFSRANELLQQRGLSPIHW